jgi:hypothetical protein
MRKFLTAVTVAASVLALGVPAFAKTMTVKGQVVDEGCSLKEMAAHKSGDQKMAEDMAQCALDCAKRGEPLALLTADGKVYRIAGGLAANKNAKLIAHMNHTVEITGDVTEKDGKVLITADALTMAK